MSWYDKIKKYYLLGLWSAENVMQATTHPTVKHPFLTVEQAQEIIALKSDTNESEE